MRQTRATRQGDRNGDDPRPTSKTQRVLYRSSSVASSIGIAVPSRITIVPSTRAARPRTSRAPRAECRCASENRRRRGGRGQCGEVDPLAWT